MRTQEKGQVKHKLSQYICNFSVKSMAFVGIFVIFYCIVFSNVLMYNSGPYAF